MRKDPTLEGRGWGTRKSVTRNERWMGCIVPSIGEGRIEQRAHETPLVAYSAWLWIKAVAGPGRV
jgi:hypothetical protein